MADDVLSFTDNSFKEFKKRYKEAAADNRNMFVFQKKAILVAYAKYVIEYVESKLRGANHGKKR